MHFKLVKSNAEDKNGIQFFPDKKGLISGRNREYSVYSQENVKIRDSHNSGTEVHVAGFIFYGGKLLLEKRNSSEASVPDKYSLPGRKSDIQDLPKPLKSWWLKPVLEGPGD